MTRAYSLDRCRTPLALALLVAFGALLTLGALAHTHDADASASPCAVCRWAHEATPGLALVLVFLVTLPQAGLAVAPPPALHPHSPGRRPRSRGPPLA